MLKPNYVTSRDEGHDNSRRSVLVNTSTENKNFKTAALPAFTVMEDEFISVKKPEIKKIYKTEAEHNAADCHNVVAFITDNKILLERYYKLRNEIFQKERGWTKKTWFECDFDRHGKIVIVLNDLGEVVGGARLMVSTENHFLSGESEGTEYTYRNLFEKIGLNPSYDYGEIDGLIVAKEYRDRSVTEKILNQCIQYSYNVGCAYLVGIAYLPYCRIYRSAYKSIGYENVTIVKDFMWSKLEEYNNSQDFPIVNVIRPEVLAGRNFQ